jgi:RNA polymerase sigma-70 factor (ECF subfamily)
MSSEPLPFPNSPTPGLALWHTNQSHDSASPRLERFAFDDQYVTKLRLGDRATEEHFAAYFTPLLRIKLRSRFQSFHDVEDLTQDVFLRVLAAIRKPGSIHDGRKLAAFVVGTCDRACMEMFRKKSRMKPGGAELSTLVNPGANVEERLLNEARCRRVREVLDELPQKDRDLLNRIFHRGEDKSTICQELGVDRDYLRVLLHRALRRFRVRIAKA